MKTKLMAGVGVLVVLLLLASNAWAMRSTNYWLDWFTPLTGGGGGPANSTNYAVNLTVGQSAVGFSASDNYTAGLGFWYGIREYRLYLPLVLRDYG